MLILYSRVTTAFSFQKKAIILQLTKNTFGEYLIGMQFDVNLFVIVKIYPNPIGCDTFNPLFEVKIKTWWLTKMDKKSIF